MDAKSILIGFVAGFGVATFVILMVLQRKIDLSPYSVALSCPWCSVEMELVSNETDQVEYRGAWVCPECLGQIEATYWPPDEEFEEVQ